MGAHAVQKLSLGEEYGYDERIPQEGCVSIDHGRSAIHYYLGDLPGSTQQVRNASRNLIFSAEYEPFGTPYSVTGCEAFEYTGEHWDGPSSLVCLRARQYDPDLGL